MKKAILTVAALGILGAGYLVSKTDYKKIPDVARVFSSVVIHRQDYEETLLSELENTLNEEIAEQMIEKGSLARKRINRGRIPAENFAQNPYDLRIVIEHAPEGDEAYLVDLAAGQKLPIYKSNQLGDLKYRISGVAKEAETTAKDIYEKAKDILIDRVNSWLDRFSK